VKDISVVGRNTQGVRLIRLEEATCSPGWSASMAWRGTSTATPTARLPTTRLRAMPPGPIRPRPTPKIGQCERSISRRDPPYCPLEVIEQAQAELPDWQHSGMSVMEISHRSKAFLQTAAEAEADLRELLSIPSGYRVLVHAGRRIGAVLAGAPEFGAAQATVDYLNTGPLVAPGDRRGAALLQVHIAADAGGNYTQVPPQDELRFSDGAAYVITRRTKPSAGVEFGYTPRTGGSPLVADMSSSILSQPIDVARFGLIYAGAQKNVGPSGLAVVVVREDLIGHARAETPRVFRLPGGRRRGVHAEHAADFCLVYAGLVFKWLKRNRRAGRDGGAKSDQGAGAVRRHRWARGCIKSHRQGFPIADERDVHSGEAELDPVFSRRAAAAGLHGLAGLASRADACEYLHCHASSGVEALIELMREFERRHA